MAKSQTTYNKHRGRVARVAAGITEHEWADRAGISYSYKKQVSKGLVPSASVQQRLALAVGVPVDDLFPKAVEVSCDEDGEAA